MSFSISEENKFITLVYDLAKKSATNTFAFQQNQISKLTAFQMLLIRMKCVQDPGKYLAQNEHTGAGGGEEYCNQSSDLFGPKF